MNIITTQIMSIEATYLLCAVVVGLGATLFMDLWALFLKRAFSIPSANYCLVGRWFRYMSEGTFTHASIVNASQRPLSARWAGSPTTSLVRCTLSRSSRLFQ